MKNMELPEKFSELAKLALDDLEKCERSPLYSINMGVWHEPNGLRDSSFQAPCVVCLAGAVLAMHMELDPTQSISQLGSGTFEAATFNRISALDEFRRGRLVTALLEYYENSNDDALHDRIGDFGHLYPSNFFVPEYEDDAQGFKSKLRELAALLEKEGF